MGLILLAFVGAPLIGMAGETHHLFDHVDQHDKSSGHAALHDHPGAGGEPVVDLDDQNDSTGLFHSLMHQAQGSSNSVLPFEHLSVKPSLRQESSIFEPYTLAGLPLPSPDIPFRPPLNS